jgi:phosphohistidine phosphatase
MTKVVALLRHAQSAGKQSGQRDYDRPLTPEGERMARAVGKKFIKSGFCPHLILSSGATRARQTVACLNESLQLPGQKIQFSEELYEAKMADWLDHIHHLPDAAEKILLVGHNPWLSMLAGSFVKRTVELAPGELKVYEFKTDGWMEIDDLGEEIELL